MVASRRLVSIASTKSASFFTSFPHTSPPRELSTRTKTPDTQTPPHVHVPPPRRRSIRLAGPGNGRLGAFLHHLFFIHHLFPFPFLRVRRGGRVCILGTLYFPPAFAHHRCSWRCIRPLQLPISSPPATLSFSSARAWVLISLTFNPFFLVWALASILLLLDRMPPPLFCRTLLTFFWRPPFASVRFVVVCCAGFEVVATDILYTRARTHTNLQMCVYTHIYIYRYTS